MSQHHRKLSPTVRKVEAVLNKWPGVYFTRGQIIQMVLDVSPNTHPGTIDRVITQMSSPNELGRYFSRMHKLGDNSCVKFAMLPSKSSLLGFM
jgi:hypothetical protein